MGGACVVVQGLDTKRQCRSPHAQPPISETLAQNAPILLRRSRDRARAFVGSLPLFSCDEAGADFTHLLHDHMLHGWLVFHMFPKNSSQRRRVSYKLYLPQKALKTSLNARKWPHG